VAKPVFLTGLTVSSKIMYSMKNIIKNRTISRYWQVAILFMAAKLIIHFLTNTRYELLRDEMLFFNMGEHLSAGYASVPPVTGFLAFLINKIFGFSVFGIRFFPALMGATSVYIIASIVKELGGGISALCIASSSYLLAPGLPVMSYENYSRYIEKTRRFIVHPLLEWDNGTKHSFSQAWADMTGWKELAGYVAQAYSSLSEEEKKKCTIFGERNYGYAGAVYFYGKENDLPDAITFNESYVFWAPDTIPDGPLIYIYRDVNDLEEHFKNITVVGSVDNIFFRENGLKVFLCREPLSDIGAVYKELARKEKSRYQR
jgi:hypothetical protein